MCFEHDARPPDLPADLQVPRIAGGAGAELLELISADGTHFSAALAVAPTSRGTGVVVFPDVRGLYPFYTELAERFASAGHHAIVIDYFGRSAGLGPRDEDFDWAAHIRELTPGRVQADAGTAVDELRSRTDAEQAATVGFCFGGTHSLLAATNEGLDLAGAVAFYGGLDTSWLGHESPLDRTADVRCPVLGLYAGADPHISPEAVDALDRGLEAAGVEREIVVYPNTPHSFFDRTHEQYARECDDAWRRVLGFLRRFSAHA
jgi:carboxymethylenebutenolidase